MYLKTESCMCMHIYFKEAYILHKDKVSLLSFHHCKTYVRFILTEVERICSPEHEVCI